MQKNLNRMPEDPLDFTIVFSPLKPFKSTVDLHLIKKSGGRWKYRIFLEALPPKPDDHITISSELNQTTNLSFKLTNNKKIFTRFNANFTSGSDPEFTIMPKFGELEPYGRDGTTFVISFTPV